MFHLEPCTLDDLVSVRGEGVEELGILVEDVHAAVVAAHKEAGEGGGGGGGGVT